MIGGGHAAIDRLLQDDLLDVIGREAAFGQCRAYVQTKFVPLAERDQSADDKHATGALIEMRPGPDIGPRMARDQVDEVSIKGIHVGGRFVDPGIAALLVVHGSLSLSLRGRSDEAIQFSFLTKAGLLRCARNDIWVSVASGS